MIADSTSIQACDIHATVLAGGEGRRMGGADKGLALFRGQALAQRAAQRIAPWVGSVSINANRNLAAYAALGFPTFGDALQAYEGPLGGVLAALKQCQTLDCTQYLLTVPCDVPFFPSNLTQRLATALESHPKANVAMVRAPQRGAQGGAVLHVNPVFMLIRQTSLDHLADFFLQGGRKITTWAALAGLVLVDFSEPNALQTFADVDDLASLEALANSSLA
jgi:molybdenum cofactor guanylyltransferase